MTLPNNDEEVLVQLDNGSFAVATYFEEYWYAGKGVCSSHEYERDILSGKVVGWSPLPLKLENTLDKTSVNKNCWKPSTILQNQLNKVEVDEAKTKPRI